MGASSASPPPPMERLRGIFLRRLEVDLLKLRPRFVAAVRDADERATTPEERARLSDELSSNSVAIRFNHGADC